MLDPKMGGHRGALGVMGRLGVLSSAQAFGAFWSQPVLQEASLHTLGFCTLFKPQISGCSHAASALRMQTPGSIPSESSF